MLTISIVTYNSERIIRKTLNSIVDNLPEDRFWELYLVDNKSHDQTVSILARYAEKQKRIVLIKSAHNLGYGGGHNLAIRAADSKYHIICNPDIILHDDVFTSMVSFMDQNREVGILCPKFQYIDGRLQPLNKRYPTVFDLFLRRFLPRYLKPLFLKRLNYYAMIDLGYENICDVPFVSGAFMFCRTSALKQVNGFDERYFLYFEDADLSRKIQREGYRTVYYPYTKVTHGYGRASHKEWHMMIIFIKSAILYFNKWGYKFW